VPHHYAPDPDGGWDEGFVDFTGPATATYTELGYIEPERPLVPLSDATGPRAVIGRMARAARRDNPLLEAETGAAVHELLVALRRARADLAPDGDPVLKALARDACLPLTVADHAARHGTSTAELRTAVRRGAGCSPKDYLLGIRLGRAKELRRHRTDVAAARPPRRLRRSGLLLPPVHSPRRHPSGPLPRPAGPCRPRRQNNQVPDPDDPPVFERLTAT